MRTMAENDRLELYYKDEAEKVNRAEKGAKTAIRRDGQWFVTRELRFGNERKRIKYRYLTLLLPADRTESILIEGWLNSQFRLLESNNKSFQRYAWKALKECPWNQPINPINPSFFKYRGQYIGLAKDKMLFKSVKERMRVYKPINIEALIRLGQRQLQGIFAWKFGDDFLSGAEKLLINKIVRENFLLALKLYEGKFYAPNIGWLVSTHNEGIICDLRRYGLPYNFWECYVDVNL